MLHKQNNIKKLLNVPQEEEGTCVKFPSGPDPDS